MSIAIALSGVRLARPNGAFVLDLPMLEIPAGEQVACIGPSGAGKTTLLHLVAGLLVPTEGRVQVGEVSVGALREGARRRIRREMMGVVFQSGALIPYLTALENVLLTQRLNHPFRSMRSQRPRALALLKAVGLAGMAGRLPGQLSAGEQQRVALCRALLAAPGLLIADEPTANLDKESAEIVATVLIEQARDNGATILCATHDETLLGHLSRRITLRQGVLQE